MKQIAILIALVMGVSTQGRTQQIDSIFFNLYTDSLKKGTHNYINVDGKSSSGQWLPMTGKEILFTSSAFSFLGNDLVIPPDCIEEKVVVKAVLRSSPSVTIERVIWIKQLPDPKLPDDPDSSSPTPAKRGRKH